MSKQMFKTLTMLTLIVGLALATAVSANGQSTSHRISAVIPFDFIVGGKTLPSGKYTVSAVTSNGEGLRIASRDGKSSVFRLSDLISGNGKNRKAKMVFHRYGQQYFLAEVWSGDNGRQLRPCKRERNLRQELASNASKSNSGEASYEIVEVALVR